MNVLLSGDTNLDFFIEGFHKFELFGQTLYITTTHICLSIVFVILIVFSIIANRAIAYFGKQRIKCILGNNTNVR